MSARSPRDLNALGAFPVGPPPSQLAAEHPVPRSTGLSFIVFKWIHLGCGRGGGGFTQGTPYRYSSLPLSTLDCKMAAHSFRRVCKPGADGQRGFDFHINGSMCSRVTWQHASVTHKTHLANQKDPGVSHWEAQPIGMNCMEITSFPVILLAFIIF